MVRLKEAMRLLGIDKDTTYPISFCCHKDSLGKMGEIFSQKEIRDKFDFSKIFVRYMTERHDRYDGSFLGWDFWVCDKNGKDLDVQAMYRFVHKKEFEEMEERWAVQRTRRTAKRIRERMSKNV